MSRLRILEPKVTVDDLCSLFGRTRQAYYQKLRYDYQEQAEEAVILNMVRDYKRDMGKLGGRKIWYLINSVHPGFVGRDRLFEIMGANGLLNPKKKGQSVPPGVPVGFTGSPILSKTLSLRQSIKYGSATLPIFLPPAAFCIFT